MAISLSTAFKKNICNFPFVICDFEIEENPLAPISSSYKSPITNGKLQMFFLNAVLNQRAWPPRMSHPRRPGSIVSVSQLLQASA